MNSESGEKGTKVGIHRLKCYKAFKVSWTLKRLSFLALTMVKNKDMLF